MSDRLENVAVQCRDLIDQLEDVVEDFNSVIEILKSISGTVDNELVPLMDEESHDGFEGTVSILIGESESAIDLLQKHNLVVKQAASTVQDIQDDLINGKNEYMSTL